MCQCGAEGMARQGRSAEEILRHYYPGAQIVSIY
jgi:stage II sporulation protein D